MQSKAATVAEYLASLPADRREALAAIRKVILANLDKGYEEGMSYGAIGYFVPHSVYPPGYHCDSKLPLPYAGLVSQKNHMGVFLFCLYNDAGELQTFVREWKATGKKMDMCKAGVRFKSLDGVPLDVVGRAIKRSTLKKFLGHYEKNILTMNKAAAERSAARKKTAMKAAKAPAKKAPKKKTATRR